MCHVPPNIFLIAHGFSVLKRCVQLPDDFCPFIPKNKRRTGRDVPNDDVDSKIGGFYIMDQRSQEPVDESIVTKCEANRELSKTMLLEKLGTFNAIEVNKCERMNAHFSWQREFAYFLSLAFSSIYFKRTICLMLLYACIHTNVY